MPSHLSSRAAKVPNARSLDKPQTPPPNLGIPTSWPADLHNIADGAVQSCGWEFRS
jgi:hypothetical protein